MSNVIEAGFNIFETGRTHRGNFRDYLLENVREVIYAPETRERIRLREAFGYYGHGRRLLAKKLDLDEVTRVDTPTGSLIIENIPACVTSSLECDAKGNVAHTQDLILENTPGKVVAGLNKSRVGGFSWACGGDDKGRIGVTRMKSFAGMDYVLTPGYSTNRGFILESATEEQRGAILEGIAALGVSDAEAEAYMTSWLIDAAARTEGLEEQISDALITESLLTSRVADLEGREAQRERAEREAADARKREILEAVNGTPLVVPEDVLEAILEGVPSKAAFYKVWSFFQGANVVEMSRLPIPGQPGPARGQRIGSAAHNKQRENPYGSAASAMDETLLFRFS